MYVWAILMASFVEFVQCLANFLLGCQLSSRILDTDPLLDIYFVNIFFQVWLCSAFHVFPFLFLYHFHLTGKFPPPCMYMLIIFKLDPYHIYNYFKCPVCCL